MALPLEVVETSYAQRYVQLISAFQGHVIVNPSLLIILLGKVNKVNISILLFVLTLSLNLFYVSK